MSDEKKLAPGVGAEARAINSEFDATGVKFHDRAATLAALKENGREIIFDDGVPKIVYDGELLPLKESLLRYAYDHRTAVDSRTLPRNGAGMNRPGIDAKDNYKTLQEKVGYINQYGADAWERLPLTGVATSEVLTREDFLELPRQERMRRYAADPTVLAKLPSASGAYVPGRAKINTEGIARHIASRGKLAR